MAENRRSRRVDRAPQKRSALTIKGLNVYYGQSHCLQNVELELESGILAVVGRNGMGKTTLCNTIMGLTPASGGSVRFEGKELLGEQPDEICNAGVGYVPQGRRVWPSLSVDEHLKLAYQGGEENLWSVERVYQTFPRLAERRHNGGGQLSGGEQQMLAIARALLVNPQLLVMDEPTEGLAPVIVQQVQAMLVELAEQDGLSVLLIEQNIGVATEVSQNVAIMVNGTINRVMASSELAADVQMQQQLLGVGRHEDDPGVNRAVAEQQNTPSNDHDTVKVYSMKESSNNAPPSESVQSRGIPNRWGTNLSAVPLIQRKSTSTSETQIDQGRNELKPLLKTAPKSIAHQIGKTVLVVGTFDTKANELNYMRDEIKAQGVAVRTVDLSTTTAKTSRCDVTPQQIAGCHPKGSNAVFSNDRGTSITAMRDAFVNWISRERDIGGIISAGGSGGTALVTPGMRVLPVGIPKIMVSTVASADVSEYVGPSDIMMMHSVADVQGLNTITKQILRNAANAMAGAVEGLPDKDQRSAELAEAKCSIGITMFGVTTPCVQSLTHQLSDLHDCLVFHCTGTGGRAMENLADSGALSAVIDVTTTEIADFHVGGVFSAGADRMGAIIRSRIPYVGSCGALDMVNFGSMETVPDEFKDRNLHVHNPQVTLMRTTVEENRWMGKWIGEKLNQMEGPVRFLLPLGGVSLIDRPGQPFYDPEADKALFEAIEATVLPTSNRKIIRVDANINDDLFVEQVLMAFHSIHQPVYRKRA